MSTNEVMQRTLQLAKAQLSNYKTAQAGTTNSSAKVSSQGSQSSSQRMAADTSTRR